MQLRRLIFLTAVLAALFAFAAPVAAKQKGKISVAVSNLIWPSSFQKGVPFQVTLTVHNKGIKLTKLPLTVSFGNPDHSGTFLGLTPTKVTLPAHKTKTYTFTVIFPASTTRPPGQVATDGCAQPSFSKQGLKRSSSASDACTYSPTLSTFLG